MESHVAFLWDFVGTRYVTSGFLGCPSC